MLPFSRRAFNNTTLVFSKVLSILIPVYNFDVRPLVQELDFQSKAAKIEFEILLFDDLSAPAFRQKNQQIRQFESVSYVELKEKAGRSKIRNLLAQKAHFCHLLFMDCDSQVPSKSYIAAYLPFCKGETVVCGGRIYSPQPPENQSLFLRWLYGTKRETATAKQRERFPNRSFMTNNFLIEKKLLLSIGFDENMQGYGHEDTLFGYELKKRQIDIQHIDNPLVHIGLETAPEFLEKTQQGVKNLLFILENYGEMSQFVAEVKLLRYFRRAKQWRIGWLFALFFRLFARRAEAQLSGNKPSLRLFDLYKLSYLCRLAKA